MKKAETITNLIFESRDRALTDEEQGVLDAWLEESDENRALYAALSDEEVLVGKYLLFEGVNSERLWEKTQNRVLGEVPVVPFTPIRRSNWGLKVAAAAAVIAALGVGSWWYLKPEVSKAVVKQEKTTIKSEQVAIVPGGYKATLQLAENKEIILNDASSDQPLREAGLTLNRNSGQLFYNKNGKKAQNQAAAGSPVLYHKVTTPRGGQFQVTLPDGSIVWLNAASSLRFPIAFAGSERNVLLTGEAFFEVRHQKNKPFTVTVVSTTGFENKVAVLGTKFNVNGYAETDDDHIRTTLAKGSVKVITPFGQQVITPGQQVITDPKGTLEVHKKVNLMDIVSWKNGLISMKGADARSFLREVERWYDVRVKFEGKIPSKSFDAQIKKTSSLADVLKVLDLNGIKTQLNTQERTIIVTS